MSSFLYDIAPCHRVFGTPFFVWCTEHPVAHQILQHSVTWRLHIPEWKIHLLLFESLKPNLITQVKQHYQQISLNHGTQLVKTK